MWLVWLDTSCHQYPQSMICIAEHSSRRAGVLIIAPQAVNPGAPTDAGEVIDAIGESHILIAILARTVIIATQTISHPHILRNETQHILEELAVPVVRPSQHGGNVMPTDQNRLHASIDPARSSVRALPRPITISSQVIIKRQALPIIRIHRHLGEERRRREQLHFDPVRGDHITGARDGCAGQERGENDERETAHGSARIRGVRRSRRSVGLGWRR